MKRLRALGASMLGLIAACSAPAHGGAPTSRRVVLLELYTSQGCSSCPPADAFVKALPSLGFGPDKVLPLTFHVDYWDDLGWKDPFATPAFTERQRRYAQRAHLRSPEGSSAVSGIYTPQMVLDGAVHFAGGRRALALAELQRAAAAKPEVLLSGTATLDGQRAVVTVLAAPAAAPAGASGAGADWQITVALVAKGARTPVTQGENRGETLEEAAVVRALSQPAPLPPPATPLRVQLEKPPALSWADVQLVAFAQSASTLRIGGATAIPITR